MGTWQLRQFCWCPLNIFWCPSKNMILFNNDVDVVCSSSIYIIYFFFYFNIKTLKHKKYKLKISFTELLEKNDCLKKFDFDF